MKFSHSCGEFASLHHALFDWRMQVMDRYGSEDYGSMVRRHDTIASELRTVCICSSCDPHCTKRRAQGTGHRMARIILQQALVPVGTSDKELLAQTLG